MAITKEQLPTSIFNRGLLGNIVPEKTAGRQMEELQGQMGSPKTPQQNIALGEFQAKPQPFTPDARYYPNVSVPDRLDFVPGNTFPSPAQAYMAEAAAERAMAEVAAERAAKEKSVPGPTTTPYTALKDGLGAGEAISLDRSDGNFISGLLGDINWKAITDKLIKTFQRPEMLTPGVNALTAFGMSGAALNQAEMAGAAAEQERMDKFKLEQLKKSGPMEFKGPMIKSIEKASATKQSLDSINRYLELLSNKKIGGVGAKLEEGVSAIGALFGAGGESGAAAADSIRSQIITGLQIGVAEGQISQGDYDQLNKILAGSGWFVSNPKVESQLQRLKGVLAGKLRTTTKILEAQGIDPSRFSPDAPSGLISARRPAQ